MLNAVLLKGFRAFRTSAVLLAVTSGVLLAVACGGSTASNNSNPQTNNAQLRQECAAASRSWTMPSSTTLPEFSMAQTVTVAHPRGENSFRAVLQSGEGELKLIALGPHGGRAFALTQRGSEVTFENYAGLELPFPPEMILRDVHRVWFTPTELHAHDETRRERVVRRTFEERVASGVCRIVVEYDEPGLAASTLRTELPPARVVMSDETLGYRVTIAIESAEIAPR